MKRSLIFGLLVFSLALVLSFSLISASFLGTWFTKSPTGNAIDPIQSRILSESGLKIVLTSGETSSSLFKINDPVPITFIIANNENSSVSLSNIQINLSNVNFGGKKYPPHDGTQSIVNYVSQSDGSIILLPKDSTCTPSTILEPGQKCTYAYNLIFPTAGSREIDISLGPWDPYNPADVSFLVTIYDPNGPIQKTCRQVIASKMEITDSSIKCIPKTNSGVRNIYEIGIWNYFLSLFNGGYSYICTKTTQTQCFMHAVCPSGTIEADSFLC